MESHKQLEKLLKAAQKEQELLQTALQGVALTPVEIKLEKIKLKKDGRAEAGKRRAAQNRARKLKRARDLRYWHKMKLLRWTKAAEGDWWPQLKVHWRQKGFNVKIKEEQWDEYVAPHIPTGTLIAVRFYNRKEPVTLENLYVVNEDNAVLWDGKEWSLKRAGYCLSDNVAV